MKHCPTIFSHNLTPQIVKSTIYFQLTLQSSSITFACGESYVLAYQRTMFCSLLQFLCTCSYYVLSKQPWRNVYFIQLSEVI